MSAYWYLGASYYQTNTAKKTTREYAFADFAYCGAKRSHSVSEQPNCYQSVQSNPYNDSSHLRDGEYIIFRRIMYAVGLQGHHYQTLRAINVR